MSSMFFRMRAGGRSRRGRSESGAYRADRGKIQTVRWLAFFLLLVVGFSLLPALEHADLTTAPNWARAVLLMAGLQAVYVVWMLVTPDWASVRVVMCVFGVSALAYGIVAGVAVVTPPHVPVPLPLDLDNLRHAAPRWAGAVCLFLLLATYLAAHTSTKWRRRGV